MVVTEQAIGKLIIFFRSTFILPKVRKTSAPFARTRFPFLPTANRSGGIFALRYLSSLIQIIARDFPQKLRSKLCDDKIIAEWKIIIGYNTRFWKHQTTRINRANSFRRRKYTNIEGHYSRRTKISNFPYSQTSQFIRNPRHLLPVKTNWMRKNARRSRKLKSHRNDQKYELPFIIFHSVFPLGLVTFGRRYNLISNSMGLPCLMTIRQFSRS